MDRANIRSTGPPFSGNVAIIEMLLSKAPDLIIAVDGNGNTPLHIAAGKDEKVTWFPVYMQKVVI